MVTKIVGVLQPTPKRMSRQQQVETQASQLEVEEEANKELNPDMTPMETSLFQVAESCEAPSSANFTADGALKHVTAMENTVDTVAMSTDIVAERPLDSGDLLKGFRKRWRDRKETSGASSFDGSLLNDSQTDKSWELLRENAIADNQVTEEFMRGFWDGESEGNLEEMKASKQQKTENNLFDVVDVEGTSDDVVEDRLPALASEASRNTSLSVFKFPWETGRMSKVFGDGALVKPIKTELQPGGRNFISMRLEVGSDSSINPKVKLTPNFSGEAGMIKFVRKVEDYSLDTDKERKRVTALKAWWKLLQTSYTANAISSKVQKESSFLQMDDYAVEVLDATFAIKSPGTISKRLYAMQSFATWCTEQMGCNWQPLDEFVCWKYVRHLQQSGAPATKGASFLEAVRFAWYLLGVHGGDVCEKSLRVRGVAAQLKVKKLPWKPASILSVLEVRTLHAILADPKAPKGDRLFVGHYLHLLYSRSRWSDLCQVGHLHIDDSGSYFEVSTRSHKGARSAELRSMLLPIVAPCKGITEDPWVKQYMEVREELGLQTPGDDHCPMLPAPMDPGLTRWAKRPLTSQEGAEHLRYVLGAPKTADRRVSTHSLKSTSMSWVSKFGVNDQARAVLARHISVVSSATAVYSRDLLSPVLRQFDMMLAAVRSKDFLPDASRSGMLTPRFHQVAAFTPFTPQFGGVPRTPAPGSVAPAAASEVAQAFEEELRHGVQVESPCEESGQNRLEAQPDEVENPEAEVEDQGDRLVESDETSEEASEETTTDSDAVVLEEKVQVPQIVDPQEQSYFLNMKSQVIHAAKSEVSFKCGRKITDNYSRVRELNGIRCSRCFNV